MSVWVPLVFGFFPEVEDSLVPSCPPVGSAPQPSELHVQFFAVVRKPGVVHTSFCGLELTQGVATSVLKTHLTLVGSSCVPALLTLPVLSSCLVWSA